MRFLVTMMMVCCCAGYSQETTDAPEAPVEITTTDDAGNAVGTEAKSDEKPAGGGCGCGSKPKI